MSTTYTDSELRSRTTSLSVAERIQWAQGLSSAEAGRWAEAIVSLTKLDWFTESPVYSPGTNGVHTNGVPNNGLPTNGQDIADCPISLADCATLADYAEMAHNFKWAWQGWIAPGNVTLVGSAPGVGKSAFAMRIALTLTTGASWADGTPFEGNTGKILWLDTESAHQLNVQSAEAMGVPLNRIVFAHTPGNDCGISPLTNSNMRERIATLINDSDVAALVVDSLSGGAVGKENDTSFAESVQWLAKLAAQVTKPVILVHHTTKNTWGANPKRPDMGSFRGTGALLQFVRVAVLLDAPLADEPSNVRLCVVKNSLSAERHCIALRRTNYGFEPLDVQALEQQSREAWAIQAGPDNRVRDTLVKNLKHQGVSERKISEQTGLHRKTVKAIVLRNGTVGTPDTQSDTSVPVYHVNDDVDEPTLSALDLYGDRFALSDALTSANKDWNGNHQPF